MFRLLEKDDVIKFINEDSKGADEVLILLNRFSTNNKDIMELKEKFSQLIIFLRNGRKYGLNKFELSIIDILENINFKYINTGIGIHLKESVYNKIAAHNYRSVKNLFSEIRNIILIPQLDNDLKKIESYRSLDIEISDNKRAIYLALNQICRDLVVTFSGKLTHCVIDHRLWKIILEILNHVANPDLDALISASLKDRKIVFENFIDRLIAAVQMFLRV